MKKIFLILFLYLILFESGCSKNPLMGGDGDSSVDTNHNPLPSGPPPVPFSQTFDFNTSADYVASSGTTVIGGVGQLVLSDTLDNATGSVGGDLDFSNNVSASVNLSVAANQVTMTSGSSGTFVSRIMDGETTAQDWTRLNFISSLPFGKEISPTAETGYGNSVSDFSNGLIGLWHLNETAGNFSDSSGSGHTGVPAGITYAQAGVFGNAASFAGNGSYIVTPTPIGNTITVSAWATINSLATNPMLWRTGANGVGPDLFFYSGKINWNHWDGASNPFCAIPASATDGKFHHYVAIIDSAGPTAKLYYDGSLCGSATYKDPTSASFTISSNATYDWNGAMDEVAVWGRALSVAEVQELYRRGANRLKFQVRTCADSTCTANPAWVGADGTNATFFTEAINNTATPFHNLWTSIAPLAAWLGVNKDNRYIQYKTIFESDSATLFPDLTSVSFDPQPRYASTNPTIQNAAALSTTFSQLTGISITEISCGSPIHYAIGNNVASFLGWNGATWVVDTGYATANTKAVLEGLSGANWALFPKGAGNLYVKVYLPSDGLTQCSVDDIQISGNK